MAFKYITGTVEITTGAWTPTATSPVYQLEHNATLLQVFLEKNGVAYSLAVDENAYIKMYFRSNNTETVAAAMGYGAGYVSKILGQELTAIAGHAVAMLEIRNGDGNKVFPTIGIPVPIIRTSGKQITSYEAPAPGTVEYLEGLIGEKQNVIDANGVLQGDGAGNISARPVGIANTNLIRVDAADIALYDFARFTENGLEGRSAAEVAAALSHNSLASKQGGAAGEYYHLTAAQLAVLLDTSGINTGDQVLPTRDSLGLGTGDTVQFANLIGTNTGDQTPSDTAPLMDGTASPGDSDELARGNHRHPNDTSRQPKITANGVLQGDGAGGVTAKPVGILNTYLVRIDAADVAQYDFARFTLNGLEGRSALELAAELSHNNIGSKQGGTTGEYYHLTAAQLVVLTNTSGINTGDETPSDATPLMDGTATPGDSAELARGNHRHPNDTSRMANTSAAINALLGVDPGGARSALGNIPYYPPEHIGQVDANTTTDLTLGATGGFKIYTYGFGASRCGEAIARYAGGGVIIETIKATDITFSSPSNGVIRFTSTAGDNAIYSVLRIGPPTV